MIDGDEIYWQKILVGLAVAVLLVFGLGIIVYVGVARDRLMPTPTPFPTPTPSPSATPSPETPVLSQVSGTVREYSPGALIIIITPDEGDVEQIIVREDVQVIWGDTGERALPQDIAPGQEIEAEGELDGMGRLIAQHIIIEVRQATPTPTHTPGPSATPTPQPAQIWEGEYYDNPNLSGDPVLTREDETLDFDWGMDAPGADLPADEFSVRWERNVSFKEGGYRFYVSVSDGIRVWVGSRLLIDEWHDAGGEYMEHLWIGEGARDVRVEYYDAGGDARVRLGWERIETFDHWQGSYFANPDLEGDPLLVRNDEEINFDWGRGSPASLLPVDNFSVRWRRRVSFEEGTYRFWAAADDGVRLYLDEEILIDDWRDSPAKRLEADATLAAGEYEVIVEYYERGDKASVKVGWERLATPTPTSTPTSTPTKTPTSPPPTATETPTRTPSPIPSPLAAMTETPTEEE